MPLIASSKAPWQGNYHALWGDGNPAIHDQLWAFQNTAVSVAGPTPTQITTGLGRLVAFRYETAITVKTIHYFKIGAGSQHLFAIYNATTGLRVWNMNVAPSVGAGWWTMTPNPVFTLEANTPYWFGASASATSSTAQFRTPASPIAGSLGVASSLPGSLQGYGPRFAQMAVTAGAWPATLPVLADAAFASAGTSGTVPILFASST